MVGSSLSAEIAALAARLIVDEGLDYGNAKRKAARALGEGLRNLPSDELVEDQVREHLAIFHADTQARELALLREAALVWMSRLAAWNPYLAGAAWRGTATARSVLRVELYADDPKMAEIDLLNHGVDQLVPDGSGHDRSILSKAIRVQGLREPVMIDFTVCDADDLRGALKPDGRGRGWRGDIAALRRLIAEDIAQNVGTR